MKVRLRLPLLSSLSTVLLLLLLLFPILQICCSALLDDDLKTTSFLLVDGRVPRSTDRASAHVPSRKLPGGGRGRDDHRGSGGGGPRGDDQNGGNQQNDEQGQSSRSHHSSSSSHGAYGDVHRRQYKHYYTSLGDVLFCLVMALAWTVWLLSSFIKSDLRKYQHESVLVRGHVLQVSVEDDSLGTGIPTYKAIIDYMVPPVSEVPFDYASTGGGIVAGGGTAVPNPASLDMDGPGDIQIRKEFETSHLLTEGFANVELLVLPHEPTYSVLKEDWERDFAMHQQQQRSLATSNNHPTLLTRSNTMGGVSTLSANNNTTAHESMMDVLFEDLEWWRSPWFRRASITGAGLLVLASVAGGIQVVIRLRPSQRCWGWAIVVVGVPLLLPAAIGIHYGLNKVRRVFELKSTLIIRGAERLASRPCSSTCEDMLDARGACDEEDMTILTSPTRATSTADGCYFVKVNNNNKAKKDGDSVRHQKHVFGVQSPSKSVASCLPLSPRGAGTTLPTQIERDQESSRGDRSSTSSVTTVSSVSMQERSVL